MTALNLPLQFTNVFTLVVDAFTGSNFEGWRKEGRARGESQPAHELYPLVALRLNLELTRSSNNFCSGIFLPQTKERRVKFGNCIVAFFISEATGRAVV